MIPRMSTTIGHILVISAIAVGVYSKEYILEDLIAMETGSSVKRVTQYPTASKNEGRLQKIARAVEATNATVQGTTAVNNSKDDDDDDKKTLAQQVADGKYGLIQAELFVDPPKRPGIISYEVNPEVPKDNINNLGGLRPEEIWLAENHLLVLAGGGRYDESPRDAAPPWPPIDNYKAPPRQVKIPPNPKVPPPFPIQLRPGGPTEFIRGANGTGGPPPFPFFPPPGNLTGGIPTPFFAPPINLFQGNFTPGNGQPPPFPFPPIHPGPLRNGSIPGPPFGTGSFPPLGLPPGANFLPPPVNITEPLDEDDPSIYYPPPYDFVYKRENNSLVPPGPLVPGIVLPPPPDFFAPLDDEKRRKQPKRPSSSSTAVPVVPRPKPPPPQPPIKQERPIHYKHHHFPTTTTRRPAVKIVTDDPSQQVDLNEVTPSPLAHVLPPNAVVQGWVPIPAPKPFYITGARKPLIKTPRLNNNGYSYGKPHDSYANDEPTKWIGDGYNYSGPLYIDAGAYYQPTTTLSPFVPYRTKGKAIKTFYFYDEPTSTPPPAQTYFTTSKPTRLQYYQTQNQQQSLPVQRPLQYFYITKAPPTIDSTTIKPPIFEYSYTAPGYGTLEAPKLSSVTTTATPPQYDNYYDYESGYVADATPTPLAPAAIHSTTARPIINQRPSKTDKQNTQPPYIVQTENPYHAFFTHHDYSLIDDITKKYFTIFGQKLNNEGPTTPLLPVSGIEDVTRRPQLTRNRVKFPNEPVVLRQHTTPQTSPLHATYPSQTYWSTPRPTLSSVITTQSPQYQQYPEYPDYYDDVKSNYRYQSIQDYYDIGNRHRQPQYSYQGDTRVNSVTPYPTKDPEAEEFVVGPLKTRYSAPSLQHDTRVNYVQPLPNIEPQADDARGTYNPYQYTGHQHNVPVDANLIRQLAALGAGYDPQTRQRILLNLYDQLASRQSPIPGRKKPPSLVHDTRVNDQFAGQNVTPDPDVEVFNPQSLVPRPKKPQKLLQRPSYHGDTRVNDAYRSENVTPDPDSEPYPAAGRPQQNGVIAYQLPGNAGGSHFYFLTPQAAGGYPPSPDEPQQNLFKRSNTRRQQNSQQDRRRARHNVPYNNSDNISNNNSTSTLSSVSDSGNNNHKSTKR